MFTQRGERRSCYVGSRGACHRYHPELSGKANPPDETKPSSPALKISLHPVGGALRRVKPVAFHSAHAELSNLGRSLSGAPGVSQSVKTETSTAPVEGNGMNAPFGATFHCVAAEPSTFLRVGVIDGGREVAYESAVLGRLRRGY
eukprot:5395260-Prymnesium_polylepis.1